jgi:putative addiction module killer protein
VHFIRTTESFATWLSGLRDLQARVRIQLRIDRVELGNFGDCASVGEGVSETRIHYGPGYRVYFVEREQTVTILLAGGTKKSQRRDIEQAKALARLL